MSVGEPTPKRWTRKAYYNAASAGAFDGERVELIGGDIVVMSPMDARHATAIQLAQAALQPIQDHNHLLRIQMPLAVSDDTEPEPDLAIVVGRLRDFTDQHPSTADLIVEVSLSTVDYDRTTKRLLYAKHAIPEYWIVNLVDDRLEIHRNPVDGDYVDVSIHLRDAIVAPLIDATHRISVADLLP